MSLTGGSDENVASWIKAIEKVKDAASARRKSWSPRS